jgi:CheY-like chemotaxis protein
MELLSDGYANLHVIYVEDDEIDRHIFGLVFNKIVPNSPVMFMKNGKDFLDFYHRRNAYCDREAIQGKVIIFLDINMPGLCGLEVLKHLSKSQRRPKVLSPPVVMFSSSRRDVDIAESKDLGASDYVVKPFSYQEMQSSLKDLLTRYLESGHLKETSI